MATEREIEALIAENPWLIGPYYELADIKGSRGRGRGIRIGTKEIDALLRNTIDDRPVIVEIKARPLRRTDIGQLAEYNALAMLSSATKELASFFINSVPELFLVGEIIDEPVKNACNLMGIKTRTFRGDISEIAETVLKLTQIFERGKNEGDIWRAANVPSILEEINEIIQGIGAQASGDIANGFMINFNFTFRELGSEFWWYVKERADCLEIYSKDVKTMTRKEEKEVLQESLLKAAKEHQGWFPPNFDKSGSLELDQNKGRRIYFKIPKKIVFDLNSKGNREKLQTYFENIKQISRFLLEKLNEAKKE